MISRQEVLWTQTFILMKEEVTVNRLMNVETTLNLCVCGRADDKRITIIKYFLQFSSFLFVCDIVFPSTFKLVLFSFF